MKYKFHLFSKSLIFKESAGTSRGVYTTREVHYAHFVDIQNPLIFGIAEFAPLPRLSSDDLPNYLDLLNSFCTDFAFSGLIDQEQIASYPSIRFGLEMAQRQLKQNGSLKLFGTTPFSEGKEGILTNGLIWMGTKDKMLERLKEKIELDFRCIKIKVGAIDFEEELSLLKHLRSYASSDTIEIRLDANGGFSPTTAMKQLEALSKYQIHSIEQPIAVNQHQAMAQLCQDSPIPIAFDEELISINTLEEKDNLLKTLKPQYIILKPSLHGGFTGSQEWIDTAKKHNINYWITSALESNIGLNAIAQWTNTLDTSIPQGLGTGQLYTNNIDSPLKLIGEKLWFKE